MSRDTNQLLKCYALASRIRAVEETIAKEYPSGQMRCPVHLSIGQELVSAVVGLNQQKQDTAVSSHRAHAHYLAKGGNLHRMIAEIYGKITGCCKGRGGSMHLIDLEVGFLGSSAIVGNSIPNCFARLRTTYHVFATVVVRMCARGLESSKCFLSFHWISASLQVLANNNFVGTPFTIQTELLPRN